MVVLHLGYGYFPPLKSRDFEEERRLLYVAITRAQEQVLLTGEDGNMLMGELCEAGEDDLELFDWNERLGFSDDVSDDNPGEAGPRIPATAWRVAAM